MMVLLFLLLAGATASAQSPWVRFATSQLRVTVPVNTTNLVVLTNFVNVSTDIVSAVSFDVSGLPAGAGATLTDTNGNALLSTMIDTNLWLTLGTTNIAEGVYTFYLNASGGAANRLPIVLQAAHVWNGANGALEVPNLLWSASSNWFGGVPGPANDVVFGDIGAQTNDNVSGSGFSFTNSIVDTSMTIGSLRFSPTGLTNAIAADTNTPPRFHSLWLNPGVTLTVSGANGFSLMRDFLNERYVFGRMGITVAGGAGSKLVVSNETANFGILTDVTGSDLSSLNLTNLQTLVVDVNRMGVGEYQIYPNYRALNDAFNGGRDTNTYVGFPRRFPVNLLLARTNIIKAVYKDPDNYNNAFTRGYAISQFNAEQSGNGSSINTFFYLGASNAFFADSVCFIGANHATGGGGACQFVTNNGAALFRSTNGTRMSVFAVADDGGTNQASSNVKANIDFSLLNGFADILADRFYIGRDRSMVRSNDNPTAEGTLTLGRGIIDVNTAILGFQEQSNKVDWTTLYGAQAYRGYCQGTVNVTNGGTFRVNGTLTLGYTADTNPEGSAMQYSTRGQITVWSNSFVMASNIVVDGGLNFTSTTARQNNLTINQGGTLIVTNSVGDAPGLPLDNLAIGQGGTLGVFIVAGKTNVYVKNLTSSGSAPGIIKILGALPTFPSYPTNIPVIAYQTATPFLAADMSAIGGSVQGYILNNSAAKTIDLFLTTNAPQTLTWAGTNASGPNWDLVTKNWVTATGVPTNFNLGDVVVFDDTSSATNVSITDVVVPNQATNGVVFANVTNWYTFSSSGQGAIVAAKLVKQGAGNLTFNATETGPLMIMAGTVDGSGNLGSTTVYSNAVLSFGGSVVGGLTSTGTVMLAGNVASGTVNIRGGVFVNSGFVNASGSMSITGGALVTNNFGAEIDVDTGSFTGNYVVSGGSVVANFGIIKHIRGRMNLGPSGAPFTGATLFGTGQILDTDGGLTTGNDGRLAINPNAIFSPGTNSPSEIASMYVQARIDLNNTPAGGLGVLRIDVDFNNPQTNDIVQADKWNNITGMILMTNINPGAGSFALGQVFQVFQNNNPGLPNTIDVNGTYPAMSPVVPAPGLQWGLADFRALGTISVTSAGLIWNGNVSGSWDTNTANWKNNNVYSDGPGVLLDDSASGMTTITLTSTVAPIGMILVTNIVPNVSTNIVTNTPTMSPGLVVSNSIKDYTIAGEGRIRGMTGLYKIGSGTLTLLTTNNDFTGNSIIGGGTVVVTNVLGLGAQGSGGINNELFFDGGTLRYIGLLNATWPRNIIINPNNATIEVASSTNVLTGSTIYGPGALTKGGPGTFVLAQTADAYAGGTTISQGTLRLTAAAAGPAGITLGDNTTLELQNATLSFTNAINAAGAGTTIRVVGNATNVSGGAWTGSGDVTISSTGTVQVVLNADISDFSGTISQGTSTNSLRFNNATNNNKCLGSAAATFDLGTGASTLYNLNGGGLTYDLGALLGGPNTVLSGRSTNTASWPAGTTYRIGANNSNSVFYGRITDGLDTVSVTKVGNGTLLLNGNSTYSGLTTVSAGTLGGSGAIGGPLTVQTNAMLAPGTSIGFFTVGGAVNLDSGSTTLMEIDRSVVPNSDRVVGPSVATASGAIITVTNVGTPNLVFQDSFMLFSTPVSGSGYTLNLPALPNGNLYWTNKLAINGTIEVAAIVNPLPPNIGFSYSGNQLTLSWPPDHKGWTLLTNAVGVAASASWFPYPGSDTQTNIIITVDKAQANVFYKLVYPYP